MDTKRWQDWVNLLLGLWLFALPWAMSFDGMAAANAYLLGIAIIVFALLAIYSANTRKEWVNMALGFWLVLSPWVLGFSSAMTSSVHTVFVGALVTALATWAMAHDLGFARWWHEHHHRSTS